MKGQNCTLTDEVLEQAFLSVRKEEIALRDEANRVLNRVRARARTDAIKRAKDQVVIAAMMGETRLYLESE